MNATTEQERAAAAARPVISSMRWWVVCLLSLGMVIGYWEQACALLNYGLLHEDLFFETSGEFFGVWEQLKNVLPQFREAYREPNLLSNLEKTAKRYEEWSEKRSPGHIAAIRDYMKQERTKAKSAGKA